MTRIDLIDCFFCSTALIPIVGIPIIELYPYRIEGDLINFLYLICFLFSVVTIFALISYFILNNKPSLTKIVKLILMAAFLIDIFFISSSSFFFKKHQDTKVNFSLSSTGIRA